MTKGASLRETGSRASHRANSSVVSTKGFDPARRPPALMMGNVMLAAEEDYGRKGVWPHHKRLPKWFIPGDWSVWPVLAYDRKELHIIAVSSARKGAFKRLVSGALESGLTPVVVGPFAQMLAIMRRWGWQQTIVGEGWDEREEWRPASAMSAFGQDPQGLEAKPASATAESGDAQMTYQSNANSGG